MSEFYVYQAKFYKDQPIIHHYELPEWVIPIQVGTALTTNRICANTDDTGENISIKNVNYCELTALYWIWKNRLSDLRALSDDYYGLFHYRRILDIRKKDMERIIHQNVDVILPYPMLHDPDIREHHTRYIKESDWNVMLAAIQDLAPEYAEQFDQIFSQPYFYNYNLLIAKSSVLANYCQWLFPILQRTEELSIPKGNERADRYLGYIGENLLTLYFLFHQEQLHIAHTGRIMLI